MSGPLLQVRKLRKSFGGIDALAGVSFDLDAGQMLALIG
ncbi:ABC transporter ATP-binding protein, partial [Burkholderia sp. SIMBA_048]